MSTREEELISVSEMAHRLHVGRVTVHRYIRDGRIPSATWRQGLRTRYEVRRVDFERVAPGLMGLAEGDTIKPNGRRKPGHAASDLITA